MTDTVRDMLLAFVRVHVLDHAAAGRVFGAGMAGETARQGCRLGPGTLCPLPQPLEHDGLPVSGSDGVAGKACRVHVATGRRRAALEEPRPRLAALVAEALPEDKAHAPASARREHSSR